jgi:hypothetical protein
MKFSFWIKGRSGLGKSTLINTLFRSSVLPRTCSVSGSEPAKTAEIRTTQTGLSIQHSFFLFILMHCIRNPPLVVSFCSHPRERNSAGFDRDRYTRLRRSHRQHELVQRKIPFFSFKNDKKNKMNIPIALVEYFIQLGAGFGIHQRTVRKVLDRGARCRENTLDSRHQSALLSILHTTYRARVYYNGFSLSVYVSWWIVYMQCASFSFSSLNKHADYARWT